MNQIINDFGKGMKQLGEETAEKLVLETGKIAESIITAKDLLGDIRPMSDEEMNQKKAEDERKKQKEISDVRSQISGRGVEDEMGRIRQQKQKEEEEKKKYLLENQKRQEQMERQKQENNGIDLMVSKKHYKDKGGNKHKTQQPDQSQMSQTAEYKGKID